MITTILAEQNSRLDKIFFKHYNNQQLFAEFLKANFGLLKTPILKGGEVVNLPELSDSFITLTTIKTPLLSA